MAEQEPQRKVIKRRFRRRATRTLDREYVIQYLREEIERGREAHDASSASRDSSGNISSESEGSVGSDGGVQSAENEDANDNVSDEQNVDDQVALDQALDESSDDVQELNESDHGEHEHLAEDDIANMTAEEKEGYLVQSLREWASSGGDLSMRKVDELLGMLSPVFRSVPKSYKTLLHTTKTLILQEEDNYQMWYKGIRANLDQLQLDEYVRVQAGCIKIDINIDGLPLNKNVNNKKFWPILGKLFGSDDRPFVIAIFFGTSDPRDVDSFLGDFVLEVHDLMLHGYEHNGVIVSFEINNFILDAPARALIKCCIGHAGYGACEKCCVVGEYSAGRIHFANVPADCVMRTDQSYIQRTDRLHHVGRSPLEFINIGMVSQFRLDTMHLVYKGVFNRFLEAIFTWEGPWNPNAETLEEISSLLLSFRELCPRDFNRKPRKIEDWYKYKATELRRLLLYDGVVVFRKLQPELYNLFLLLHCGIYILSSSYLLPVWTDEAEVVIKTFVDYSVQVFGEHFAVYNVHSLTHLVQECRHHGTLESFSAFPFENELKTIKQTLRSGYRPLQQIMKRDSERLGKREVKMKSRENSVQLFNPHNDNPDAGTLGHQFKRICVNGITFKTGPQDSCLMTNNGVVFCVDNIIQTGEHNIVFHGRRFNHSCSAYSYPLHSACLGILKVWELNHAKEIFPLEAVFSKCWLISYGDSFVSFPLAHSTPLLH